MVLIFKVGWYSIPQMLYQPLIRLIIHLEQHIQEYMTQKKEYLLLTFEGYLLLFLWNKLVNRDMLEGWVLCSSQMVPLQLHQKCLFSVAIVCQRANLLLYPYPAFSHILTYNHLRLFVRMDVLLVSGSL